MENAPEAWRSALHSYEFTNYMVQLNLEDYGMTLPTNMGENPTDLDELVSFEEQSYHTGLLEHNIALPYPARR